MAEKYQFKNRGDKAKMQKICDFLKMGRVLNWISLQVTTPCISLMKLKTTQGTYSFKEYTISKKNQLQNACNIKKLFISRPISLIYQDEISCWLVTPWIFGEKLPLNHILPLHVERMAKTLGKIHQLNMNFPKASDVLRDDIMDTDFSDAKFLYWRNLFEQHANILKENRVISHGDLLPQNVIWTSDEHPILIDWDNAGWINQDVDLFNTAINWAGIESGVLNKGYYDYFIKNYLTENPRKIEINTALISASLGSWLNWWVLNDQLGNQKAVDMTIRSLEILERVFL